MTPPISLRSLAEAELSDETVYYFEIEPPLGLRFLDHAERAFSEVVAMPRSSPIVIESH